MPYFIGDDDVEIATSVLNPDEPSDREWLLCAIRLLSGLGLEGEDDQKLARRVADHLIEEGLLAPDLTPTEASEEVMRVWNKGAYVSRRHHVQERLRRGGRA
jgi:hypothetical protein